MSAFPTNINLSDTTPPAKPDALNVEWQGDAPVPDPNSPGTYVRNASACYRYPKVGGIQVITDDYLFSQVDSGFTFIVDSASAVTLTMPAAPPVFQSPAEGVWFITIKNINTGVVTVDPNGLNFDGSPSTFTVAQDTGFEVSTDGTDYYSGMTAGSGGGGASTLAADTDVSISSPANRDLLIYHSSDSKWHNDVLIAADVPNIAESQVTSLISDLALKAPLASPALTGTPTAPTPTTGDDSTKIATTAFVEDTIDNLVAADIPSIAESQVTGLVSDLALKAPLASPALTGTPTAPTAAGGTNTTQIATTAFVQAAIPAASPLVFGFVINNGAAGTNVGPELLAARAGTVTKCVIVVKTSDGTTGLTFKIKKNGTDVFSVDPSVAAATAGGTVSSTVSLTSNPLSVAANDVFTIDITSGSPNWAFTAQLET